LPFKRDLQRYGAVNEAVAQVAFADRILLNKVGTPYNLNPVDP
jgi:G3E family GTPase